MQYQIRIQFAQIQIGQTFKDLKYIQTLEIHRIDIQALQLQIGHTFKIFNYKKFLSNIATKKFVKLRKNFDFYLYTNFQ